MSGVTNPIKRLAGETAIYGMGTIVPRLLNYLLTPFFTRVLVRADYSVLTEMYSWVAILLVILTYGMETAFFRFSSQTKDKKTVYGTAFTSILVTTILFLIIGVMGYQWYIMKIASLFFAMGIFSGIAMGNNADQITKLFLDGAKDIMGAALIVGLAGGIIAILQEGQVIDTILYKLSQGMQDFGRVASIGVMYFIQTVINIIIPSGSAKAALTMPIMAPFSDLIGISRQATVMAFQFGDGFTNMITPTSGVLIGVIGVAKIPYEKWVRWVWPLILILMVVGFLLLIPTVTMELNGF